MYLYSVAVIVFSTIAIATSATVRNDLNSSAVKDAVRLSAEHLSTLGQFQYVGKFNNKDFYMVFKWVNQEEAAARCAGVGLKLAKFETADEILFVKEHTSALDDAAWVGGLMKYFHEDGSVIDSTLIGGGVNDPIYLGLFFSHFYPKLELNLLKHDKYNFVCSS